MSNDTEIEKEIQDKGLTAPRITTNDIENTIVGEQYQVFEDTCFTTCLLTLKNGFNVSGESACASPENFDAEIGKKIALGNAKQKIWALEGYLLKQFISENKNNSLCFGLAIKAMKKGFKVARKGWNGKDMWITLSKGNPSLPSDKFWNQHNSDFAESNGGSAEVLPFFSMKTADDKILMGWLASQTDMLAEDWEIIL